VLQCDAPQGNHRDHRAAANARADGKRNFSGWSSFVVVLNVFAAIVIHCAIMIAEILLPPTRHCFESFVMQGVVWKKMGTAEPGSMFGFSSFADGDGTSETTVVVNGSSAILLKIPPPPPLPGKMVPSELSDLAAALALQESQDISEFLARERLRAVEQRSSQLKVRAWM
jgi:hypothetical protein